MFTVLLHNSTTTPPQPGYSQLMRAALADVQADAFASGQYRLRDGAEIYFVEDAGDDISMVEYPALTPAVSEAIFEVARRTGSLVLFPGSFTFRIAGNPGEPPGELALAFGEVGLGEIGSAEDLDDLLADLSDTPIEREPAIKPSPKGQRAFEDRSFFQRLTDVIFGSAR